MIDRCFNENNAWYHRYGGRGVTICKRWLGKDGYKNFLMDMGERPPEKSIDRFPARNGNYEPGNCRWATAREQTLNRDTTRLTEDLVQEIHGRHEHGESNASIAVRIHVAPCHVSLILSGAKWKGSKYGSRRVED